jgi:hypothetical protein
MKQLAVQFGVHRTTAAGWLRKLGIPLRRQGLSEDELDQAVQLYQHGWSLVRLGTKFQCDAETIRQGLIRRHIPRCYPHER